MITEQGLSIVALTTSILSMLLSMVALWPHWRERLAVIRDVVLWVALAIVVAGLFQLGWSRSMVPPGGGGTESMLDYAGGIHPDVLPSLSSGG